VVPDPLHTVPILPAGENVKAYLGPVGQTLGNLKRLVQLMVGGVYTVHDVLLPIYSEIGMKLNHGALWFDRIRPIYLDLVITLGAQRLHAHERGE
jgi:hypothetical protein